MTDEVKAAILRLRKYYAAKTKSEIQAVYPVGNFYYGALRDDE